MNHVRIQNFIVDETTVDESRSRGDEGRGLECELFTHVTRSVLVRVALLFR